MKKVKQVKENAHYQQIRCKYIIPIILTTVLSVAIAGFFAFAAESANAKSSMNMVSPVESNVPEIKMTYNNNIYDMSPFILVNNGRITTIALPNDNPDQNSSAVFLQLGDTVHFQFNEQPSVVHAFIADYEGDLPSLHELRELRSNDFQIAGPVGVVNLEVHAFFPDGRYTSQGIIANISTPPADGGSSHIRNSGIKEASLSDVGDGGTSANSSSSSNNRLTDQQPCDKPDRLVATHISSSMQSNNTNSLARILDDNNLGTAWKAKGADIGSFIASSTKQVDSSSNQNPWLQLDLGDHKTVCNVALSFGKRDNSINFFSLQTSTDGIHFKDVGSAESNPIQAGAWLFTFPDMPDTARYIRLSNVGNVLSGDIKIAEFIAGGITSNNNNNSSVNG